MLTPGVFFNVVINPRINTSKKNFCDALIIKTTCKFTFCRVLQRQYIQSGQKSNQMATVAAKQIPSNGATATTSADGQLGTSDDSDGLARSLARVHLQSGSSAQLETAAVDDARAVPRPPDPRRPSFCTTLRTRRCVRCSPSAVHFVIRPLQSNA